MVVKKFSDKDFENAFGVSRTWPPNMARERASQDQGNLDPGTGLNKQPITNTLPSLPSGPLSQAQQEPNRQITNDSFPRPLGGINTLPSLPSGPLSQAQQEPNRQITNDSFPRPLGGTNLPQMQSLPQAQPQTQDGQSPQSMGNSLPNAPGSNLNTNLQSVPNGIFDPNTSSLPTRSFDVSNKLSNSSNIQDKIPVFRELNPQQLEAYSRAMEMMNQLPSGKPGDKAKRDSLINAAGEMFKFAGVGVGAHGDNSTQKNNENTSQNKFKMGQEPPIYETILDPVSGELVQVPIRSMAPNMPSNKSQMENIKAIQSLPPAQQEPKNLALNTSFNAPSPNSLSRQLPQAQVGKLPVTNTVPLSNSLPPGGLELANKSLPNTLPNNSVPLSNSVPTTGNSQNFQFDPTAQSLPEAQNLTRQNQRSAVVVHQFPRQQKQADGMSELDKAKIDQIRADTFSKLNPKPDILTNAVPLTPDQQLANYQNILKSLSGGLSGSSGLPQAGQQNLPPAPGTTSPSPSGQEVAYATPEQARAAGKKSGDLIRTPNGKWAQLP